MEIKNEIKRIMSQNLEMRRFEEGDAEELVQKITANREAMLPWIGWVKDEPESVEAKRERIKKWKESFGRNEYFSFAICLKETGEIVGSGMLFTRKGPGKLEIGYWIDQAHTGKGFATECSYALAKMAFEHIKIEQVLFFTDVRNVASGKVPQKLGYEKEYTYREVYRDENGERIRVNVWSKFIEDYKVDERYEPVLLLAN